MEEWCCYKLSLYDPIWGSWYQFRYGKNTIVTGWLRCIILYRCYINIPYEKILFCMLSSNRVRIFIDCFQTKTVHLSQKLQLPFTGCPGSSRTWNGLQKHFNRQHWGDSLQILEDHPTPFPKYKRCGSQVPPWRLGKRHYESDKCRIGEERHSRPTLLREHPDFDKCELRPFRASCGFSVPGPQSSI